MYKLVVQPKAQGRIVIPRIVRDHLGIAPGTLLRCYWEVDENDQPVGVLRVHNRACEICGAKTDLQEVGKTDRMICGACKTELIAHFTRR